MADITRRNVFAILAAFAATPATAVGISAGADISGALRSLGAVTEGRGRGTLSILIAPWCPIAPVLYRDTRSLMDKLTLHWIPFSGGQPEGLEPTELLLRNEDPALLPSVLGAGRVFGTPGPTPLCDVQDRIIAEMVSPLIIRDTGLSLSNLTLVYALGDGRNRIVPNGVPLDRLEEIAAIAG